MIKGVVSILTRKNIQNKNVKKKREAPFFFFCSTFSFFLVSHCRYEISGEKRMPYIMRGVGGVILFPLFLFLS